MDRTKGYNSYHGRDKTAKILIAVGLVVVILAASGYLVAQNYMVYDEDGTMHIELPFLQNKPTTDPIPAVDGEDVQVDTLEPVVTTPSGTALTALHAQTVGGNSLKGTPEAVLATVADNAMVIEVKRADGGITYASKADAIPPEVKVEQDDTMATLQTLLASDHYTVARMSVFCDSYYVRADREAALRLSNGGFWYDANGAAWLDPANERVLVYTTALCQEYAQLGFDEILLDNLCYPTNGRTTSINGLEGVDRAAVLTAFVQNLRANLPEGTVLSVMLHTQPGEECGLSAEMLGTLFDRIYVDSAVDMTALQALLPDSFDSEGRLVSMTTRVPESGSYLLN